MFNRVGNGPQINQLMPITNSLDERVAQLVSDLLGGSKAKTTVKKTTDTFLSDIIDSRTVTLTHPELNLSLLLRIKFLEAEYNLVCTHVSVKRSGVDAVVKIILRNPAQ